jgi:NAD(P)-dependent dehydrogenase (short-subunit alcohol dehydrogenase family)
VLEERLSETVAELGESCAGTVADISQGADCQRLIDEAVDRFGRLDVLVNNAGISRAAPFLDLSEEDFDAVLGVNIRGAFLASQAAARQMVREGHGGTIVNLSSINAIVAIPGQTAYTISKGAIHQLTRSSAIQLAQHGIRVNAIGPGTIDTEMAAGLLADAKAKEKIMSRIPLGRLGGTDEIAAIALFLASEESSYVTGETIYADGGRLALNLTLAPDERGTNNGGLGA